jgi:hypothetical protein
MTNKTVSIPIKLDFEYCECGCHGFEAKNYWIYSLVGHELDGHEKIETPHLAVKGHKYGVILGWFKTWKQAKAACLKSFKQELLTLAK